MLLLKYSKAQKNLLSMKYPRKHIKSLNIEPNSNKTLTEKYKPDTIYI